jgi:uncharacterized protein DUF4350
VRFLALAMGVALFAADAAAAPLDPYGTDWEGLSQLVSIAQDELGADRVVVTKRLELGRLTPGDALLLLHPERKLDVDELFAFVDSGGRIALLDDFGSGDGFLSALGARRTALPERPNAMLRSNPSLAIAESIGIHPLVRDVTRVVANHATGVAGGPLRPLLVVRGKPDPVVLAGASVMGRGRIVVVGDSSIAMNAMLRYPGNRSFASALMAYCGPGDPSRSEAADGKLYVLVNDFSIEGRLGAPFAHRSQSVVRRIAGQVGDALRDGVPPTLAYAAAIAVGMGVVVWTAVRAGKTYRMSTPSFVQPIPVKAQGGVAGHAAALASAAAPRETALRELKVALEEQLATRLGLEQVATAHELVDRVKAAGLLDDDRARMLAGLLQRLSRIAARAINPRLAHFDRVHDAEMRSAARDVRALLAAVDARRRGTVRSSP